MQSSTIDMDFNFLKTVQKVRAEGHNELRRLNQGQARNSQRKLDHAKRKSGFKRARERGVDIQELPQWMERTKQNKTKWDSAYRFLLKFTNIRMKTVSWTVEWVVTHDENTQTILQHQ
jgi:hypothetical protein